VGKKKRSFIGIPKEATKNAVFVSQMPLTRCIFQWASGDDRIRCRWKLSYSDKEYSDAGAEVTKDTAKVFGCPYDESRDLPPLLNCNDEQPDNPDLIDPIKNDAA
jgi:hypothetical protein